MKGTTVIKMNQETIQAAVQKYLSETVFKDSQKALVEGVEPIENKSYGNNSWTYEVTIQSDEIVA